MRIGKPRLDWYSIVCSREREREREKEKERERERDKLLQKHPTTHHQTSFRNLYTVKPLKSSLKTRLFDNSH